MDWILLIISILLILTGIIGCLLPVLPGPPFSFLGILFLHISSFAEIKIEWLIIYAFLAIIVTLLDYVVPIWGTKKFGGSKRGILGSTIGLIVGLIILPILGITIGPFGVLGILLGPFLGAYIGEYMNGKESEEALRSAFGSFVGFVAGTLMKLSVSLILTFVFIKEIWIYAFNYFSN